MDLPNSPKTEAKGVILVRVAWYETPGSPDLPFTLKRGMSFPSVFEFWDSFVEKSRRGRLVNWVEKAGFKKI